MLHFSSPTSRFSSLCLALGTALGAGSVHAQTNKKPQISFKGGSVKEGNSAYTALKFTATLSKASPSKITVDFNTIGRTAVVNQDFKNNRGRLTFAPNTTVATITVQVVGEVKAEDNETFRVHLYAVNGATLRNSDADGVILNDDGTPTPGPGTGKIVFTSSDFQNPGLFVINSDGTNLTRVTTDYNDSNPVWSPDGKKIAFESYFIKNGFYSSGLGVVDADGKNRLQVTSNTFFGDTKAVWSSDSTALIYRNYSSDFNSAGLFSAPVNGDAPTQLTQNFSDTEPSVSKATGTIAFSSFGNSGGTQIFTVDKDGEERTQITTDTDSQNLAPQITADGKKIVFLKRGLETVGIYIMNVDGTDQKRLVETFGNNPYLRLSSDSKKFVFTSTFENTTTIYTGDLLKGNIKEISAEGTAPVFSPDGTRLAFVTTRDGNSEIYTMSTSGTSPKRLTNNSTFDTEPDFAVGRILSSAGTTSAASQAPAAATAPSANRS